MMSNSRFALYKRIGQFPEFTGPDRFRIVINILAFGIGNLGASDLLIILLIVYVPFGAENCQTSRGVWERA